VTSTGGLMRTLDLLRSNVAVEISKAFARSEDAPRPAPRQESEAPSSGSYAAPNSSSRPAADSLAGLRIPAAVLDNMDLETVQTLFKNVVTTNPAMAQASLSNAMAAAANETPNPQPGEAASRQGFRKDDAAQLAATALPINRLRDNPMPPAQQVSASGSRAELWEGAKAAQLTVQDARAQHINSLQHAMQATGMAQPESAAMAASLIFNAAVLPGLPFHRQQAAALLADPKVSEEDVLNYLEALGADDEFLKKFRKAKTAVGKKLLIYLAMLLNAFETVAETMANELAMLAGDETSVQESRERANSRGHAGPRHHVYVE
jgi:hypothetical protein